MPEQFVEIPEEKPSVIQPTTFEDFMILLNDLLKKRRSMANANLTPEAFNYYYKMANQDYEAITKMVLKLTQENDYLKTQLDCSIVIT